ncbi:PssD/Cps14F family polysaccharide biosynthesis glycosyltransferase [Enterococcus casseliflavus]|uniref:PssD/Cps14F family polysaccharide biosynthesis glycosyltransferase n=1 Tax=Enterococcus casseliflavus TaxID=37734 RepID=UPI0022E5412A|nr:PssD/Cps14F family polysaccharide biosynthesis glycosyltransferase [Enterococcus casseliflavus]
MKKICLISSSGGHYEQLMMLEKLVGNFSIYIITEKTEYTSKETENVNKYYISQLNRKEFFFIIKIFKVFFQSLVIFLKEKPDIIISTGALSVIPTFMIGKIFKRKLIFIESFAKVKSPTLTGKFIYKFADLFLVQWESMLKVYPKAIFLGNIY